MTTETKRTVKITWVDGFHPGAAAMLGLDETIETDWTVPECYDAAVHRAQEQGVDITRYVPEIEEIED